MRSMKPFQIRAARPSDSDNLAHLRHALWPDSSAADHAKELDLLLTGKAPGILPATVLVAEAGDSALLGFLEAGLRSHADGCDPSHAVGYVEGWYVIETHRRVGIGAALLSAAEDWARAQGCTEMASDTQLDNLLSQHAHQALGFQVAERSILYRKPL
jgi:aminoglycoside 6'-N-acetyltransferase I